MRRNDREITDSGRIDEIIKLCDCCRIGLCDNGKAYIVPLNFGYENKNGKRIFYFHSAEEGKKIDLIRSTGFSSFELDTAHKLIPGSSSHHCTYLYQSVMGNGKISIVQDKEEKLFGLNSIMFHYTGNPDNHFKKEVVDKTLVIKLEVEEITCKAH